MKLYLSSTQTRESNWWCLFTPISSILASITYFYPLSLHVPSLPTHSNLFIIYIFTDIAVRYNSPSLLSNFNLHTLFLCFPHLPSASYTSIPLPTHLHTFSSFPQYCLLIYSTSLCVLNLLWGQHVKLTLCIVIWMEWMCNHVYWIDVCVNVCVSVCVL